MIYSIIRAKVNEKWELCLLLPSCFHPADCETAEHKDPSKYNKNQGKLCLCFKAKKKERKAHTIAVVPKYYSLEGSIYSRIKGK